jgi:hypothetical protein
MRDQLDQKTEDLDVITDDENNQPGGKGRRRSSIWAGLAEV